MADLLGKLNPSQKEAVLATEGPVMVMAGAGTGKTRVLTHRIAYIIENNRVSPYQILAVTFTNKAAREMKERVAKLIDLDTSRMWISTFHSFCSRLLRIETDNIFPYHQGFQIIDDDDTLKIIKGIMKSHNMDCCKPQYMAGVISKSKNGQEVSISNDLVNKCYERVSEEYKEYKENNNLIDFDDLIGLTLKLFKENPNILRKYQDKFLYILVDEFQDTNTVQYQLMHLLALNHHNIFVVGDQDQSIYSFRGAKIENINHFQRDFLETKVILLENNYRSTKEILNAANSVISKNNDRIKKNLTTNFTIDQKPFLYQADSSYDEVMFVIDKIRELKTSGIDYADMAIMYRANVISRNFEDMLVRYQIPYVIYGGLSYFGRKEVKDVIAYLRVAIDFDNDFSLLRIINEPKRKIGNAITSKLQEIASSSGISLLEAIDNYHGTGIGYNNLIAFKQMIFDIKNDILNNPLDKIIDIVLNKTGYYDMLKANEDEDRIENVLELKTIFKEVDEYYDGEDNIEKLKLFLDDLALRTNTDNLDDSVDKIKLMSYHQAKGLEFRVVFMVATEEGIFPSMTAICENEVDEERRICYVGITRAKEKLYITNAKTRFHYGHDESYMPSRFIKEMNSDNYTNISRGFRKFEGNQNKTYNTNYASSIIHRDTIKKDTNADTREAVIFKVGDKISHKMFGDGVVVQVDGSVITVAFDIKFGIKKLVSSHPSIRKIEK